ncbi:Pimeloyl-ACP methyl ester carboxylesterase [Devosia lucknowensis]|uniref:Pimeloyl-ACP methyl ester carboxylesterase n=1 Tax=Devosia lucknowensis TaxID=1096929 RepID=A0A1Y6ENU1_9HYPH|nr:alpha/beta hydrolase [Devosia lucknowensis]SMQ62630.1 Pimeloyl-ACP methyl ester carboxylesterase [Devosia lucknowensis]
MISIFQRRRLVPDAHPAFAGLQASPVTLSDGRTRAAVHLRGDFGPGRMPLVGLAGYHRNMSDFTAFADYFQRLGGGGWPLVLIDLPGRGRADDRPKSTLYSTLSDARDVADILAALGIGRAVILGQGHGGQVAMALGTRHPLIVRGVILLDAGPVTDSRGIVRLRNNLAHIHGLRGSKAVAGGFRRMLGGDYPGHGEAELDALALRSHWFDKRGRARALFDERLIEQIKDIGFDDVLTPQWPLYDALKAIPLMLLRTQLTDQVRRETFEEMVRRRPDAVAMTIAGQGSPALFDDPAEIEAIADFVFSVGKGRRRAA